jgi:hypothetical protein
MTACTLGLTGALLPDGKRHLAEHGRLPIDPELGVEDTLQPQLGDPRSV